MGDMHFDESEFWSVVPLLYKTILYWCFRTLGRGQIVRAVGGKTNNDEVSYCHFPFWHDGVEYKNCASTKSPTGRTEHPWCSLTSTWQNKWGYCGSPTLYTYGGNANGR